MRFRRHPLRRCRSTTTPKSARRSSYRLRRPRVPRRRLRPHRPHRLRRRACASTAACAAVSRVIAMQTRARRRPAGASWRCARVRQVWYLPRCCMLRTRPSSAGAATSASGTSGSTERTRACYATSTRPRTRLTRRTWSPGACRTTRACAGCCSAPIRSQPTWDTSPIGGVIQRCRGTTGCPTPSRAPRPSPSGATRAPRFAIAFMTTTPR
mgnify:CR=1 FL=1